MEETGRAEVGLSSEGGVDRRGEEGVRGGAVAYETAAVSGHRVLGGRGCGGWIHME